MAIAVIVVIVGTNVTKQNNTMANILAIVGRPNVGKSTLFNRLTKTRRAIVTEEAGTTRDRQYGHADWCGKEFSVIDTGGWVINSDDIFEGEINRQVDLAIKEADVVLLLVDVNEGVTRFDMEVAHLLRQAKKECVLGVNKVDAFDQQYGAPEFYKLGLGEPFILSAENGLGTGDLLDEICSRFKKDENGEDIEELPRFAIVGRPNAGKSSLVNSLMDEATGSREQKLIETVALRAMMKAKYSTHNIGHYGLAFDYYTHFTSPIRRYPDTMVHRLLTRYQDGGRSVNQDHYEELCEHCSQMEQTAQYAERDSIKYKMVEFMADKVGLEFDAHISGVQSYGLYCEIDDNHCEGLVGMHDLDGDYYEFDERNYCLVGRRTHHKYQLGDAVRIKVARANIEKRQLDFILAD